MEVNIHIPNLPKRELLLISGFLLLVLGGYAIYAGFYPAYILMIIGVILIGYTFGKEKSYHEDFNVD